MTSLTPFPNAVAEPTEADRLLAATTQALLAEGCSANTIRTYRRGWADYGAWCRAAGRMAFPSTPETLASYVDHLAGLGNSPTTIRARIACIRRMHTDAGFEGHPGTALATQALKGYSKRWAADGGRRKRATPIVLESLCAMIGTLDLATAAGVRDRALLLLGFVMFGRRSEIAALDLEDLTPAPDGLDVLIRMSKTDQDAKGETVFIPYGDHEGTCPVRAVRAWRDELADHGITTGPLFRSVDAKGRIAGSPDRPRPRSLRLTGKSVNDIIRKLAQAAGLEDMSGYSAHSMRAGGATTAYLAGAPVAAITGQGRWSPKSATVLGYIRAVDQRKNNPMKGIGL